MYDSKNTYRKATGRWLVGYERKAHILYFKPKLLEKVVASSLSLSRQEATRPEGRIQKRIAYRTCLMNLLISSPRLPASPPSAKWRSFLV